MSGTTDPRCPECGEPIGQRATYCMHCSTDLTEERAAADVDEDGVWDQSETASATSGHTSADSGVATVEGESEQLLAPDGIVDNTLTVVVGVAGGVLVGVVGTIVLLAVTGSGWAVVLGLLAWLGSTAYLVRRRTVQGAVAKTGYAVAVVLLLTPVVAFSPAMSVDGGIGARGGTFFVLLLFVAIPAGVAAAVGWVASQFVPDGAGKRDG
jgi:hypothetical protein